jgi:casein kinase 1 alpha
MDQTGSAVSTHSSNKSEFLVSGKYRLVRKIGSGSFGDIYLGINVTNGEVSAVFFCFRFNVEESMKL